MTRRCLTPLVCCVILAAGLRADGGEPVKIGIARSIFRDVPPALLKFANQPFLDLMKSQTGLDGEVFCDAEAMNLARDVDNGKLQLGVLSGHEYAWAKQKYPDLEPLVCSVPKPREVQAFILIRHDNKAASLGDMKGAKLVLAAGLKDHAKLFFEKRKSEELGSEAFCSLAKTSTVHDAIHKVIDGDADITAVDQASWSYFQKLYPGPAQNVKVLAKSDVFPPNVVVCKKGALPASVMSKFRDGMLAAHQNPRGAKLLLTVKIDRFDRLPENYADMVKDSLKNYPAPPQDQARADK